MREGRGEGKVVEDDIPQIPAPERERGRGGGGGEGDIPLIPTPELIWVLARCSI